MKSEPIPIQIEAEPHEAGTYKGKSYKSRATLNLLAHQVLDQLRSQELPIWQVKEIFKEAIQLLDWESLK